MSVAEETLEGMTQGHKEMMTAQESMKLTQVQEIKQTISPRFCLKGNYSVCKSR